jgi:hypothetical protein
VRKHSYLSISRVTGHLPLPKIPHVDYGVNQPQADWVVIIPVLDSYRFGLSQSLQGATTFVETLRSPHAFLMHGGLPCILRI